MNRDEKDYDRNHEKEHESHGKSYERSYENHEKGHENHDRNHEKESAPSPSPPSSRYTIDSSPSLSQYAMSPSPPSSRYTIDSPLPSSRHTPPPSSRHTTSLPLQHAPSLSRQSIFSSNINLVHGVVSKYKIRDSYIREEAVSVGMEELWNCTERWKEEKGKFSTYAWRCVDGKVIVKKSIKS